MQKACALFLQAVVVLIAAAALAFLIWEPQAEGVNAHASGFAEIYLDDPLLAYAYVAAIPVFVALYHGFRVLGLAGRDALFSPEAVKALRTMRLCAIAMIGFVAGGEILILQTPSDDGAGGVAMGVFISFAALLMGAAATLCERIVQKVLDAP